MEPAIDIRAAESEPDPSFFDAVELVGLLVPLLFAILAIVLVAMNPDPAGGLHDQSAAATEKRDKLEQIQRR